MKAQKMEFSTFELLAAEVRRRRNAAGLTLNQLSQRAMVSVTVVFNLESGINCPDVPVFDRIMKALEIPIMEAREALLEWKVRRLRAKYELKKPIEDIEAKVGKRKQKI